MQLPETLQAQAGNYSWHPALLDSCFHVVGAALPGDGGGARRRVPAAAGRTHPGVPSARRQRLDSRHGARRTIERGLSDARDRSAPSSELLDDEGGVIGDVRGPALQARAAGCARDRTAAVARARHAARARVAAAVAFRRRAARPQPHCHAGESGARRPRRTPRPRSLRRFRAGARSARRRPTSFRRFSGSASPSRPERSIEAERAGGAARRAAQASPSVRAHAGDPGRRRRAVAGGPTANVGRRLASSPAASDGRSGGDRRRCC